MPISDKVQMALRVMETSSTTEGLIASAIELSGWAQYFIKEVRP